MPYLGVKPADEFTSKDLNGEQLILDADADTTITADTDDQIDIRIAGEDDFQFTANTLTALSGSTIATNTIAETTGASGVTVDGLLIKDSTAAFADGAVATPSITNTGDTNTGIYFPAADTVGVVAGGVEQFRFGSNPIPGGSKNVLINGGMTISQRGTSVSGVGNGDNGNQSVPEDMWYYDESGTTEGVFTISQEDNGGTNGQDQWMKILCTTEEALGSTSDMIFVSQKVEGFNATRLLNGSSGIAETTVSADIIIHADAASGLSFPVKVAFSIHTWDGTGRQCVGDVSIAANDTWERVSVTFPSDSTATFDSNNAAACHLTVSICGGSGKYATNLTWANDANDYLTSATDNIADQANNYLGMTNVQWEVGSVATDFAHEDYGTTLHKCQRYYLDWTATTAHEIYTTGQADNATQLISQFQFPTTMRAAPTFTAATASYWNLAGKGTAISCTAVAGGRLTINGCQLVFTVASGLTAGEAWNAQRNTTNAAALTWSAEL